MMDDASTPIGQPTAMTPPGKLAYATPTTAPLVAGRRSFFKYRDLGVTAASSGKIRAQVTIGAEGMTQPTGWHYHVCEGQFVYMLSGWVDLEFEDGQKLRIHSGESLYIPGGLRPRYGCIERPGALSSPFPRTGHRGPRSARGHLRRMTPSAPGTAVVGPLRVAGRRTQHPARDGKVSMTPTPGGPTLGHRRRRRPKFAREGFFVVLTNRKAGNAARSEGHQRARLRMNPHRSD